MKSVLALALVLGMSFSGVGRADDAAKPAEAKPAADETRSGKLTEKPANAVEGVVAVLRGQTADLDVNLAASGDLAAKLAELLKKGSEVQVSGPIANGVMKVANVVEVEAKKPADPADNAKAKKKDKKEKKEKKKAKKGEAN